MNQKTYLTSLRDRAYTVGMTSTTNTTKFWDHAKNMIRPVDGWVIAKARRDAIADGGAWRVDFTAAGGEQWWWNGTYHCALELAKDTVWNGGHAVLTSPTGTVCGPDDIRAARY